MNLTQIIAEAEKEFRQTFPVLSSVVESTQLFGVNVGVSLKSFLSEKIEQAYWLGHTKGGEAALDNSDSRE